MTYINGYDHPHVIAGQGTIGIEIIEQIEDVDAIIVPVGGGLFKLLEFLEFSVTKLITCRWTHRRNSPCS